MLRAGIIGTARVGSWYDDLLAGTPEQIPSSHAACYAAHPTTELVADSGYIELQNGVRVFLERVTTEAITFVFSGTEGRLVVMNDARVPFPLEDLELGVDTW